jgi:hypothetical protein
VKRFRDKYTAHLGKPNPQIPFPEFREFFSFARETTVLLDRLARATGARTEGLDAWTTRRENPLKRSGSHGRSRKAISPPEAWGSLSSSAAIENGSTAGRLVWLRSNKTFVPAQEHSISIYVGRELGLNCCSPDWVHFKILNFRTRYAAGRTKCLRLFAGVISFMLFAIISALVVLVSAVRSRTERFGISLKRVPVARRLVEFGLKAKGSK